MRKLLNGTLLAGIIVLLILIAPTSLWQSPTIRALLILGIYTLKPFLLFVPLNPLYLMAGLFFPLPLAFLVTVMGLFLNMTVGYLLGRHLGISRVPGLSKFREALAHFDQNPKNLCFLTRLFFFPIDPMHCLFGAMGVKFSDFVLYTYLGVLPKAIVFLILGESVSNTFSLAFLVPFAVSLGLALFVYFQLNRRIER